MLNSREEKDQLEQGDEEEQIPTPEAIESEKNVEAAAEEAIEEVQEETKSTIDRIKGLAQRTIEQLKRIVGEQSPESKESRDYKETALRLLEELMEMGFPEEGEVITKDIMEGSLDEKIARLIQIGNAVSEKIPPIDIKNVERELAEIPEGQSKTAFLLKKAGGALTEAGVDVWLEDKLVAEGAEKTKEIIADNIYLKMTAVAAKKLLSLYNAEDKVEREVDPETGEYKEEGTFKTIIKRGLPILKKILEDAVTEEDEEEAKEFLGEKAKELLEQVVKK